MPVLATRATRGASVALVAALAATACDRKSPSPPPPPETTPGAPGATQVTGTERLAWFQAGDLWRLEFRAIVDGSGVPLGDVACEPGEREPQCSAPLPPLTDGVHTIAVSAVYRDTGAESEPSAPVLVQKVAARRAVATALPADGRGLIAVGRDAGLAVDVVLAGVTGPAQLAPLPDGRLLVADAAGRVTLVRPDGGDPPVVALDAAELFDPPPAGPLTVAAHPDFVSTRRVFVAYLYVDGPDRVRGRIVRMREVGDRLGEPAAIADAAVLMETADAPEAGAGIERLRTNGPRLAFGPDGLLYALLPAGFTFDGQPAASRPVPAILRLTDEGRTPAAGGLPDVSSHPLGLGWHPSSGELLGLVPDGSAGVTLRALAAAPAAGADAQGLAAFRAQPSGGEPVLRFEALLAAGAFEAGRLAAIGDQLPRPGVLRLAAPAELEGLIPGLAGRLEDVVWHAGAWYAAVTAPASPGGPASPASIVRLRTAPRAATRPSPRHEP
ncbi:MAG: PQQ-dependent sugar dehydrogenase [Vicinamibacterales bacterium]